MESQVSPEQVTDRFTNSFHRNPTGAVMSDEQKFIDHEIKAEQLAALHQAITEKTGPWALGSQKQYIYPQADRDAAHRHMKDLHAALVICKIRIYGIPESQHKRALWNKWIKRPVL